jgi:hypothetical protein
MSEHKQYIETWKLLHADLWKRYANSPENEKILFEGAQRFRPCITGVDRSFHENKNSFTRTDGKTYEDDSRKASHRKAEQDAALEASTVVDADFISYVMSLSQSQISGAYYADPASEFARKYRVLIREHGFQLAPNPPRNGFYVRFPQTTFESLWGETADEAYQKLIENPRANILMPLAEKYVSPPEHITTSAEVLLALEREKYGNRRMRPGDR